MTGFVVQGHICWLDDLLLLSVLSELIASCAALWHVVSFFNIINACTVMFDQFKAYLLNKSINFFKKRTWNDPIPLEWKKYLKTLGAWH